MSISSAPSPDAKTGSGAIWMRSLRAISGLYILAYVTLHLLNLSLGLISLSAMEAARPYLSSFWTGPLTGPVLLTALLVHYLLGLWAIYTRPRISGTAQDLVQALSGLLVIPLMATHVIGTKMLKDGGFDIDYANINRLFWLNNPGIGLTQVLLISVVWVHGCAGFFTWLRALPRAAVWLPWLYPLGVAVPVLALLGYTQAGRIVLAEGLAPAFDMKPLPDGSMPPPVDIASVYRIINATIWGSAAISLLVGGIGIMNIMLANTTERKSEIGLRRALGAKRSDIVSLFVSESLLLCIFGGAVGVAVGFGLAQLIGSLAEWTVIYHTWSIPLGIIVSAIVGLIFGTIPAIRAAQQDPVLALRSE